MLLQNTEWNNYDLNERFKIVTYERKTFYGPYLKFLVVENSKKLVINPIETRIETASETMSDVDLIIASVPDLLQEFGAFTLKIPKMNWSFKVKNSEKFKREIETKLREIILI